MAGKITKDKIITFLKEHWIALSIALIVAGMIACAAYLRWVKGYVLLDTGFEGKTIWQWLELVGIPIILALAAGLFTWLTGKRERELAEKRAKNERNLALDRQREEALQAYFDNMTELLLEKELRQSPKDSEVRDVARTRTLTTLRFLDGKRKGSLIQFLYESKLIFEKTCIISLDGADISGADLRKARLNGADLRKANLKNADLSHAFMREIDLDRANLGRANLSRADLRGASLKYAYLYNAELIRTGLNKADLTGAELGNAYLLVANLSGAKLIGTTLAGARLHKADLSKADLKNADMRGAILYGAIVTTEQLQQAKSLEGAIIPKHIEPDTEADND